MDDNAGGSASNVNVETFTADGTWTKPDGLSHIVVKIWGGGGAGGNYSRGGGGGSFMEMTLKASDLASSETVTVASRVTSGNGEDSSFGSHVTAYGGKNGNGGDAFDPSFSHLLGTVYGGGAKGVEGGENAKGSIYGGGGAGDYNSQEKGGDSIYGGGGGGGGNINGNNLEGLSLYGGNGGNGGDSGLPAEDGQVPGGGGGGGFDSGGGAGARGEVQVFEYFE